ncbi:MAG TPA: ATP-binding protein [Anaeromyxobacter sp.]|nr:ATP-binding protein [Anaeromyxobacter sp.]
MRFRLKIALVLLPVGLAPVALLGSVSWRVSRDELQHTVGRMQTRAAGDLALFTDRFVADSVERLRLAVAPILFDDYSPGELSTVLSLPFRQLPFVTILAVVSDQGAPVAGPVFVERPEAADAGREAVAPADLDLFVAHLPRAPAQAGATALSEPYRRGGPLKLAVALRVGEGRTVAAELSLHEVETRLSDLTTPTSVAYLVDGKGDPIAGVQGGLTAEERRLSEHGFEKEEAWSRLLDRGDGQRWLAAFSPVPRLGWGAVVAQAAAVAFRAAERLRLYTLWAAGAAVAVAFLIGAALERTVTRPVARLSRAAASIAASRWDELPPAAPAGGDELADLGRAFAAMAGELRRRDDEIRGWNRELQDRVEERTRELKAAEDQILRTRRLAALGSLGAGLAHELNNPMTAIVGYLAILRRQVPPQSDEAKMIAAAQEQAARVTRVVEELRSFADQERTTGGVRFPLERPVHAALALFEDRFRAAGIKLTTRIDRPLPEAQGDPVQIQQVVSHLLDNAVNAMPNGGALEVTVGSIGGEALRLRIADTGRGIPVPLRERIFDPFFTTKEDPGRMGLGLSVSHSIVEAHHGKIVVDSAEGAGASVTVLLPSAAAAHLA